VFGRLDRICPRSADADRSDTASGTVRQYIGRIGLRDEQRRQLLVDWRAPAAEAFYRATAARPAGVRLRRHLKVRNRCVVAVHDDLLAASGNPALDAAGAAPAVATAPAADASSAQPVVGEAALLAAVNEARDGRMRDIVVTLQADQDRIIRSPLRGALVVQGAPGTGKTAVALHRAGYLLYTHRERLAASGVLLLGPSDRFLRYIENVLPSLGETSVVSATLADLYPGVDVYLSESPDAAAVKGDLRMVQVLRRAVELRRRIPRLTIPLPVEDTTVQLRPAVVRAARRAAQPTAEPRNQARESSAEWSLTTLSTSWPTGPMSNWTRWGGGSCCSCCMPHLTCVVR
jgi:DNA helicase IV